MFANINEDYMGGLIMSDHHHHSDGFGYGFALILVLFILLVIVGALYCHGGGGYADGGYC